MANTPKQSLTFSHTRPHTLKEAGQLTGTLAMWILLLLAIIALMIFVAKWRASIEAEGEIKACQYSIQLFTTISEKSFEQLKPTMRCPAPHQDFSGDQSKLIQSVADDARKCWLKTMGRQNGLARSEVGIIRNALGIDKGDSFCVLCSSFSIDKPLMAQDVRDMMAQRTISGDPTRTYKDFLDTSWIDAGIDPLNRLFLDIPKPGAIPLPPPEGKMQDVSPTKLFNPGSTYYTIAYGKKTFNTVVIATQSDSANLACDRFLQQREVQKLT